MIKKLYFDEIGNIHIAFSYNYNMISAIKTEFHDWSNKTSDDCPGYEYGKKTKEWTVFSGWEDCGDWARKLIALIEIYIITEVSNVRVQKKLEHW